jgi:hypothetical protein
VHSPSIALIIITHFKQEELKIRPHGRSRDVRRPLWRGEIAHLGDGDLRVIILDAY